MKALYLGTAKWRVTAHEGQAQLKVSVHSRGPRKNAIKTAWGGNWVTHPVKALVPCVDMPHVWDRAPLGNAQLILMLPSEEGI